MENPPQISLSELLRKLSELGGSDLHVTTGTPPLVRVHGTIRPLDGYRPLTSSETKQLAYSVLTDAQKHRFEENLELDFSFGVKGLSRFRANLFNQRGAVGAVFRAIPYEIKSFEDLGLPPVVQDLCKKPRSARRRAYRPDRPLRSCAHGWRLDRRAGPPWQSGRYSSVPP